VSDSSDPHVIMWSGGKDGCLALWRARILGICVSAAINFFDASTSRVRFHALRTEVIAAQAESLGLELIQVGTLANNFELVATETLIEARRRDFAEQCSETSTFRMSTRLARNYAKKQVSHTSSPFGEIIQLNCLSSSLNLGFGLLLRAANLIVWTKLGSAERSIRISCAISVP
jgi:diphthamide synthase